MSESVRRLTFLLVAVGALSALLPGCGGGEKAVPALSDAELREMVMITSEGLPWTIAPAGDEAQSNEQAAAAFPDPQQWLSNYQKWGRSGGAAATFTSADANVFGVQAEVEAYSSVGGAKSAWAALRDLSTSAEFLRFLQQSSGSDVTVGRVDAERVGDESGVYLLRTTAGGQTSETLIVLFRRDVVVASASVGAPPGEARVEDAVTVAEQVDGRIQDILNGQTPVPR
jgi:hypothetical protein